MVSAVMHLNIAFFWGFVAGMLLERTLAALQERCEKYYRCLLERKELDEFWSER